MCCFDGVLVEPEASNLLVVNNNFYLSITIKVSNNQRFSVLDDRKCILLRDNLLSPILSPNCQLQCQHYPHHSI